jgi:hypothetical protein
VEYVKEGAEHRESNILRDGLIFSFAAFSQFSFQFSDGYGG